MSNRKSKRITWEPRIIDIDTKLWFGKHKGKTFEQLQDKPYFIYLRDNTTINMTSLMLLALH